MPCSSSGWRGGELEVEAKAGAVAGSTGAIAAALGAGRVALEAPVAQHHGACRGRRRGDAEAAARDALVVQQATVLQVGHGGMGEHQLPARTAASAPAMPVAARKNVIWKPQVRAPPSACR